MREGGAFEFGSRVVRTDDHNLRMRAREPDRGASVGAGIDAKLLDGAGKNLQGVFGFVAIAGVVGVRVKAHHQDGSRGISRGRRRILKRFATNDKRAESDLLGCGFCVEEAAGGGVAELRNRGIADLSCEAEVAEIAGGFVGVEACERGEDVVVEQTLVVAQGCVADRSRRSHAAGAGWFQCSRMRSRVRSAKWCASSTWSTRPAAR